MNKVGIAALVALLGLILVVPSLAGASVTGGAVFDCVGTLPVWPGVGGPAGPLDCMGTAAGYMQGRTTTTKKYRLAAASTDNFVIQSSRIIETCTFGQLLSGTANGTFTISNLTSVTPSGAAVGTYQFEWTRLGAMVVLGLHDGLVTWSSPSGLQAVGTKGTAVAAFVPLSVPPGSCTAPGTDVKTRIVGLADFS